MIELIEIQSELKVAKEKYNNFGKYNYRKCEDILEALKPLLKKHECVLRITDDIIMLGDRFYVKATAKITKGDCSEESTAFARESLSKKGMDDSQITGTASSYARKFALGGLFLIDDSKDSDSIGDDEQEDLSDEEKEALLIEAKSFFEDHGMNNRADIVTAMLNGEKVRHTYDSVIEVYKTEKAKVGK